MYEEFYSLTEKPFQLVPNPEYLYLSTKHKNALTYLEYGLSESAGFVLLTGEIGSGKTTLIRYLLNQIEADMEVAVIFNTNVNSEQLLDLI
jgi:general secretion pathway protein A